MDKLTRRQAAIISAYTGFLSGPFEDLHEYAEKTLGRPIFTHEMGFKEFSDELREATKADFLAILPGKE
jgi:hypothetical protein